MFFLYVVGVPAVVCVAAFVGFFAVTGGTAVGVYLLVAHLSFVRL